MSVLYNYTKADGSITNNPYEYDANGQQIASNQYQGRADGTDPMKATYATPNAQQYTINDGSNPMPMPSASNAQLGGSAGGRTYLNDADGAGFIGSRNTTYGINPYLQQQANGIQSQVNQNLNQNILPGIRSGAQANGQYGGSRQGIAEGVAAGNAAAGMGSAISGLYSNAYSADQANQTQRMGIGANYNLGLGSLGNSATAQNQNFYSQQRAQDLQQMQLGAGMYGSGINGQVGVGTGLYGVGNSAYQAPLNSLQQYSNVVTPYTGLNSAQQIDSTKGGGAMGALGGAVAGAQLASNNLGFGSNIGGSAAATQNWTYQGNPAQGANPAGNIDWIYG